jgi:hypothetical protein
VWAVSLLIISSQRYSDAWTIHDHGAGRDRAWWAANVRMVCLLLCASITGHTLGLVGMANTAATFAVLYALEKYGELHLKNGWNG